MKTLVLLLAAFTLALTPLSAAPKLKCKNCVACEKGKCSPCKCKPVLKT